MIAHDLQNSLQSIAGLTYFFKAKYASALDQVEPRWWGIMEESIYSIKLLLTCWITRGRVFLKILLTHSKNFGHGVSSRSCSTKYPNLLTRLKIPSQSVADSVKFSSCIVNIITNLFDTMPNGGILTVTQSYNQFPRHRCWNEQRDL
jgi:hypothetical protein